MERSEEHAFAHNRTEQILYSSCGSVAHRWIDRNDPCDLDNMYTVSFIGDRYDPARWHICVY